MILSLRSSTLSPCLSPKKHSRKRLPKADHLRVSANIKALKLGLFNPTEELEKMNEGAERPA